MTEIFMIAISGVGKSKAPNARINLPPANGNQDNRGRRRLK